MSFIPRQLKLERDMLTIRLESEVHQVLQQYTEFLESSRDYVIGETLRVAFAKDREFQQWLAARTPPVAEPPRAAVDRPRRRRARIEQGRATTETSGTPDLASV